ncbi:hypothetical protein BU23DRAFT_568671 [Bimuria novae-zelandiae CBS 107.79]|uniref:Uncharacterized protein n=1 Tax=Bimuria novae-zelandiae CBS 107.79 TaxID=1447943 RepID=A0A6A5V6T2_9PLEO|nr:hypothetical protein BU23DRAFT_568671 [Bimuria novae-zelandiae CBS 107.79]
MSYRYGVPYWVEVHYPGFDPTSSIEVSYTDDRKPIQEGPSPYQTGYVRKHFCGYYPDVADFIKERRLYGWSMGEPFQATLAEIESINRDGPVNNELDGATKGLRARIKATYRQIYGRERRPVDLRKDGIELGNAENAPVQRATWTLDFGHTFSCDLYEIPPVTTRTPKLFHLRVISA